MPAPVELLQERFSRVRDALKEQKNGAPMLVTDPSNVGWLTGIAPDFQKDAHVIVGQEKSWFITDGRYENRIPEIPGVEPFIWAAKHPHRYPDLKELVGGAEMLVLDTRGMALDIYQVLPQMLDVKALDVPPGFIDRLRMIKGDLELTLIREAVDIAIRQFRYMVDEWLPQNWDTATDLGFRDRLEEYGTELGGEGVSFDSLVATDGDADTPHPDMTHEPRLLKNRKVMLVDWGITYKGVCTDMTRMVVMTDELPPLVQGMKMLQESWMQAVIEEIKPGFPSNLAGQAYVDGLRAAGIEKPFHGAGHGTGGAYVHELPRLTPLPEGADDFGIPFSQGITLEAGMIVTSEPGMYEKGEGAYRTENMVLVTRDGREILDEALSLDPFFVKP